MKMTWQNGRKLTSLKTKDKNITYKYDSNGLRTQKDDNNYTTCYYYDSKNNLIGIHYKLAPVLYFYYDSNGNVTSFSFNDTMYYYVKNLQGDVVKIIDKSGREVVTYTYDAWGKILNQTDSTIYNLANLNPFKYRSYVYDNESGLYYLQSRYYDPVTGRFLNADDTQYIQGNVLSANLFTYCVNNPIKYEDNNGTTAKPWGNLPFVDEIANAFQDYINELFKIELVNLANSFLSNRGWYLTSKMFSQVVLGEGHSFGPDVAEMMAKLLYSSTCYLYNSETKEYDLRYKFMDLVKILSKKKANEQTASIEFRDGDLHFSAQHCKVTAVEKYTYGRRYIKVIVRDRFDFDQYREATNCMNFDGLLSVYANNFGCTLQERDLITPYDWNVSFTYYY